MGDVEADKGIESLTYSPSTGFFYAGIQGTATVHVVALDSTIDSESSTSDIPTDSSTLDDTTTTENGEVISSSISPCASGFDDTGKLCPADDSNGPCPAGCEVSTETDDDKSSTLATETQS